MLCGHGSDAMTDKEQIALALMVIRGQATTHAREVRPQPEKERHPAWFNRAQAANQDRSGDWGGGNWRAGSFGGHNWGGGRDR
jgi:hypothetical protein